MNARSKKAIEVHEGDIAIVIYLKIVFSLGQFVNYIEGHTSELDHTAIELELRPNLFIRMRKTFKRTYYI